MYKHGLFVLGNASNRFSCIKAVKIFFESDSNPNLFLTLRADICCTEILIGISPVYEQGALYSAVLAGIAEKAFVNERTVDIADRIRLEKQPLIKFTVTA